MENEKIKRYLSQAYECYFEKDFSYCKDYVLRVLNFQPDNADALVLRMLLAYHKGSNGRYLPRVERKQFFSVLKKWINDGLCEKTQDDFLKIIDQSLDYYYSDLIRLQNARYGYSNEPKTAAEYLAKDVEEVLSLLNGYRLKSLSDKFNDYLEQVEAFLEDCKTREREWIESRIEDEEKERRHKSRKIIFSIALSIVLLGFIAFATFMSKKGSQLAIIGWVGILIGGIGLGLFIRQY